MDAEPTAPRPWWRRRGPYAVAVAAVAIGGGVALAGAGGSSGPHAEIHAWALHAPALPIPVEEPVGAPDPAPASRQRERAAAPPADEQAPDTLPSGAPSDEQVAEELERALSGGGGDGKKARTARTLISAATVDGNGMASIPPDAPNRVVQIIQAANAVARKPYVYGGGHGRFAGSIWSDTAYDCSGSISYALAAAGVIDAPMVSGAMAEEFEPGPGKWVTIYANGGHAFMFVAGLRFDTSGLRQTGSRWQSATRGVAGFREVHPRGL
ncbi:hypothetical protein [Patulibacter defluvii]|uniref:hypothetical protein n=1 Tax=Patulibacter defluvii TaxID=3095358 RepID=UPI002A75D969|nr:hypothetical protein [Patulibacter sp. DM4]